MTDKMLLDVEEIERIVNETWRMSSYTDGDENQEVAKAQVNKIADSIKARREYAFRQAGYGSGTKRAEFRAMVDAYDLILGDLK